MSCEEMRSLFSDHFDGALPLDAEDRLGHHLEVCAACREELARYEAGLETLTGLSPEPPPDFGE